MTKLLSLSEPTCNTCANPAYRPFHLVDEHGKTIMGCVDEFHKDYVIPCTAYSRWYNRQEANQIRRRLKQMLQGGK